MTLLWGIVAVLVAVIVGVQFAYMRSTAGLKGAGAVRIIRSINIALLMVAVGLAAYATLVAVSSGGR